MKNKMTLLLALSLISGFAIDANAGSFFRSIGNGNNQPAPTPKPPAPAPTPTPPPVVVAPPSEPTPTPPPSNGSEVDVFFDVSPIIGQSVDQYYSSYRSLMPQRSDVSSHATDFCHPELDGHESFADRIAFFVNQHTKSTRAHLAHLSSYYGIPSQLSAHTPTSISGFPMCRVTSSSLTHTIGSNRVPAQSVINKLNQFTDRYNNFRKGILEGDLEAEIGMNKLWTRFMSCLAYTESLTTADNNASFNVANKYAPSNYRKPAGVKFYEDPLQNEASRLNIGLFQFTPTASGNINPCLRQWNAQNPSCQVATNSSRAELIRVMGSSFQTFNAFCGVNKIQQSFAMQVNSNKTSSTHPENFSGGMKSPQNRCVTPFFLSGRSYNHFGPLQNSTGKNLDSLMTCALRE